MSFKINPADTFAINLLADGKLEANAENNTKSYHCYDAALRAFLVNLLGSELYLKCKKGRGFDCLEQGRYSYCVEYRVNEIQDEEAIEKENAISDKFAEFIESWKTIHEIANHFEITTTEADELLSKMHNNWEIVVRRFDDVMRYKLA